MEGGQAQKLQARKRRQRRAEQRPRPPVSSSSSLRSLRSPSGSRRRGAYGRRTAARAPPPPLPPPQWRPSGSAGPCPVPKRCWDSRGICGSRLPNFLGRTVSVHALLFPTPPAPPSSDPSPPLPRPLARPLGGQRRCQDSHTIEAHSQCPLMTTHTILPYSHPAGSWDSRRGG